MHACLNLNLNGRGWTGARVFFIDTVDTCHSDIMLQRTINFYTWNLFVLYFWDSTLQRFAFSNQNKGHLGSTCIYIYMPCVFHRLLQNIMHIDFDER